jgi:endo-1,4-beta-xylanase
MINFRGACAASMAVLLVACGGGGGDIGGPVGPGPGPGPGPGGQLPDPASAPSLEATLAARYGTVGYPIGAAIEPGSTTGDDATLLRRHFSSLTAENAMKPDTLWPNGPPSAPNFAPADQIVAFAEANGMAVRGHTLLWHRTAPAWLFQGDTSNAANYRFDVQENLRTYITTIMTHFPEVYAWDVVNEVATDEPDAVNPYRTDSPWYQAYSFGGLRGADYVRDAFVIANVVRTQMGRNSSNLKLMLNDYNTELPGKRANVMRIVEELFDDGVPIDGVGHQFHLQLGTSVSGVIAAFEAVEDLSTTLENHVTELDVSIYNDPGECFSQQTIPPCRADYGATPPQSALSQQATLYRALFNAFDRESVTSITTWGIADNHTWLNTFPVTRTNRPLLFDTSRLPKWAFWAVVDPTISIP